MLAPLEHLETGDAKVSSKMGRQQSMRSRHLSLRDHHMKKLKHNETDLQTLKYYSKLHLHLVYTGMVLAIIGISLTAMMAEMCRYGYVPTDKEMTLHGLVNPYSDDNAGCNGKNESKLWSFQAFISFTTLLLATCVTIRTIVATREKERTVLFVAQYSNPPDIEIIKHKARRHRLHMAVCGYVVEMLTTVLVHPLPGYKQTLTVQALERKSQYQFESIIVIFMFGRIWHFWLFLKYRLFHDNFVETTYVLGHQPTIVAMLRQWGIGSSFSHTQTQHKKKMR
eukprot:CAMPEP_0173121984 /NCGR_PEP_ID=MMETSP1102-20130122/53802_1 /TAXON_ID=49646 /ORGANISM="Geminigera sp., Strain Caron Lab Isolate" /LENGTH=280 /DNA_ID=CAMNT_0014029077 /DNA_START=85 /DNA_END=923 /DNA_ORIENTATION=+